MLNTRTKCGDRRIRWIISVALVLTMTYDAAAQRISITPEGVQIKPPDERMMLRCSLEDYIPSRVDPMLRWKAPSGEWITATTGDVYTEQDGHTLLRLFFRRLSVKDAGVYSCEVTLGTRMLRAQTTIEIIEPVTFEDSPSVVQHELGSSPLLSCMASGSPAPRISWRFNRTKIQDSNKYKQEPHGLRVSNIALADNGTYACRAVVVSQGTLKVKTITLVVLYPPVIVHGPKSRSAIKHDRVVLGCRAHGNPAITYEWYREQKISADIKMKVQLTETRSSYVIQSVRESDTGRYFCKVSNSLGIEEAFADLNVLVPPEVEAMPHKVAREGRTVIMVCRVSGVPEPNITWHRLQRTGGQLIEDLQSGPRLTIDNTQPGVSRVVIDDVRRSDASVYTCRATNEAGTDSQDGELTVEYLPTVNMTDGDKLGWVGEKRTFTCVGQGLPLPTMNWERGSQYISRNNIYDVSVERESGKVISTLEITIEKDQPGVFGEYSCIAKNQYGYVTKTVLLKKAHLPAAPRSVSVVNETATTVILSASCPEGADGLPVTSWMVKCEKEGGGTVDSKTHFFGDGSIMSVTGLEQGQTYILYLAAANAAGFGDVAKIRVRTQREIPAEQPVEMSGDSRRVGYTSVVNKRGNLGDKARSSRERTTMTSRPVNNVSIIIGVAVSGSMLLVVGGAVLLCRRRRRKRDDYALSVRCVLGGLGPTTVDDDMPNVVTSPRFHDRPLPDIVHQKNSDKYSAHKSPACSRRQHGDQQSDGGASLCGADTPTTIQRQAWEQMLQKHDGSDDGEQEGPRMPQSSSVTSLPPPPSFLLDGDADADDDDDDDAASYQDILDGYHSEDNIDDNESPHKRATGSTS